jgi:hypothetical protein
MVLEEERYYVARQIDRVYVAACMHCRLKTAVSGVVCVARGLGAAKLRSRMIRKVVLTRQISFMLNLGAFRSVADGMRVEKEKDEPSRSARLFRPSGTQSVGTSRSHTSLAFTHHRRKPSIQAFLSMHSLGQYLILTRSHLDLPRVLGAVICTYLASTIVPETSSNTEVTSQKLDLNSVTTIYSFIN